MMHDFDEMSDLSDPDKDIAPTRTVSLNDGNFLHLRKEPVFGFWKFHLDKGRLPVYMNGSFTSISEAKKSMDKYLTEKYYKMEPDLHAKTSDTATVKEEYKEAVKKAYKKNDPLGR